MAFCGACGTPVPERAVFCVSCGRPVTGGAPASQGGNPPFDGYAGVAPPPPQPWGGEPSPTSRPTDLDALHRTVLAAAVGLVAGALGIVVLLLNSFANLFTVSTGATGRTLTVQLPPLWVASLVVGVVLGVAVLVLWRGAFRALRATDGRFTTPASLALVAVVGVVLALVGLVFFLVALEQLIGCVGPGNPITAACLQNAPLLATGGLILLAGAIVALVGYIGILFGIWRLGTRFSEPMFKVGAVLLLFPYLSLVGSILLLVAARSTRRRLEGHPIGVLPSFPGPT